MDKFNENSLLNRKEAADFLGVTESTLAVWQCTQRRQIPMVKVGRLAKYRYGDLLRFVDQNTVNKPQEPVNGNSY